MSRRYLGSFITYNPVEPTSLAASGMWPLNQQLQETAAGTWPLTFGDPYFNYTTLLLSSTSLSNANNNLFVDSSGAFNPISRNGNTTQGAQTPYGSYWSNYFDGSGDYLTLPPSTALAFGTGDFTVEFWMQSSVFSRDPYDRRIFRCLSDPMAGTGNGWEILLNGNPSGGTGQLIFSTPSAGTIVSTTSTVCDGTWKHIAVTRQGNTFRLFVNGALVSTGTATPTISDPSSYSTYISWFGGTGAAYFNGYLSNVRFIKGTALYTAAFTPPAYPLTAINGTSLLTCQSNRFRDASGNNLTVTPTGDMRVTDYSPFLHTAPIQYNQSDITNWSGCFDGSGDYLDVPNSTAFDQNTSFTVEMWVYPTVTSTDDYLYSQNTNNFFQLATNPSGFVVIDKSAVGVQVTSSAALAVGVWTHIAMVSNGSTISLYINGTSQGSASVGTTATSATTIRIGAYQGTGTLAFNGYISNLRVVKGTAVYTSNFTPPTSQLTAISGTSLLTLQNAAFTDNSTNSFVITPNGNVTVTGNSPFNTVGYWSNYFDGSGDYLSVAYNSAFNVPGNFTVEAWIYQTSRPGSASFINRSGADYVQFSSFELAVEANGTVTFIQGSGTGTSGSQVVLTSTTTVPLNTWTHIAGVKNGSTSTLYINGVQAATGASGSNDGNTSSPVVIGARGASSSLFTGYISNARLVKGTAVYTSNFTVPTTPLTAISGTSLLTCQNGRFIDNSSNNFTITRNGDVSVQSFDPFYTATIASNGGSMYFDGGGDYLISPSSPVFDVGTGDFTIEFWGYWNAVSSTTPGNVCHCVNNGTLGIYIINTQIQLARYNTGGDLTATVTQTVGQWDHYAITRQSGTARIFKNGVLLASGSVTTNYGQNGFQIGTGVSSAVNGYIANLRFIKGTAVYTSNFTPPTAPVTPTPATTLLVNGMNAGIYDATAISDFETVGNAQVSTVQSKFGASSVYFDGTGDYLVVPNNVELQMGSGNFTIEFWWYPSSISGYQTPIEKGYTSSGGLLLQTGAGDGKIIVYASGSGVITASTAVTLNTWNHMALVRNGTSLVLYLNGTSVGSATNSTNFNNTGVMGIGANASGGGAGAYPINGYLDDLRITKGYARYTANFTPPTAALPTY